MAEAPHLLVVDDDDRIRSLLKRYLSKAGYRVTTAEDASSARTVMTGIHFDLAILDIMMPGEDGLSLMEAIRERNNIPIIILSAKDLGADRIEGLKRGADDYLVKPFEPEELSLRIAAILRRVHPPTRAIHQLTFSGLIYDRNRQTLRRGEEYIRLTEAERDLLGALCEHPGEAIDRAHLAQRTSDQPGRSLDVRVNRLRQKIEPNPKEPVHLQTIRGVGYRLIPD